MSNLIATTAKTRQRRNALLPKELLNEYEFKGTNYNNSMESYLNQNWMLNKETINSSEKEIESTKDYNKFHSSKSSSLTGFLYK